MRACLHALDLTLTIGKPVKKLPEEVTISATGSTADLYTALAEQADITPHRLRISKGSDGSLIPSSKTILVSATGVRQQSTIYVKDLGELYFEPF